MADSPWTPFPLDAAGWSILPPAGADVNYIYISQSTGNDQNNGTINSPVKTLSAGASKVVAGKTNILCLRCGDTWTGTIPETVPGPGGPTITTPTVWTFYAAGNLPLPVVKVKDRSAFRATDRGSIFTMLRGIELLAQGMTPDQTQEIWAVPFDGVFVRACSYFSLEGVTIRGFRSCVVFQSPEPQPPPAPPAPLSKALVMRRCTLMDCHDQKPPAPNDPHPTGLFVNMTDGVFIEECIFDHCGWKNPLGAKSDKNHNAYIHATNINVTTRGNISLRASAAGIQQRPGGESAYNFFGLNPTGFQYGLVRGTGPCVAGGVTGTVRFNVVMGGATITPGIGGIACLIGNIKDSTWSGNLACMDTQAGAFNAYDIEVTTASNDALSVGVQKLTMDRCLVYLWPLHLKVQHGMTSAAAQSKWQLKNVNVNNSNLTVNDNVAEVHFNGAPPAPAPDLAAVMQAMLKDLQKDDTVPNHFIHRCRAQRMPTWDATLTGTSMTKWLLSKVGVNDTTLPAPVAITLNLKTFGGQMIAANFGEGQLVSDGLVVECVPASAVDSVTFVLDDTPIGTYASKPYFIGGQTGGQPTHWFWPQPPGRHQLRCILNKAGVAVGSRQVTVYVAHPSVLMTLLSRKVMVGVGLLIVVILIIVLWLLFGHGS